MDKSVQSQMNRNRRLPVRWILAAAIYLLLLSGTYTYVKMTLNSQKWALIVTLAVLAVTAVIAVMVAWLNRKDALKKTLPAVMIAAVLGTIIINAYLLNSSYFVPHKTTTVLNRYFPVSLETSVKLQDYLEGKTLYVDPTVTYFDRNYDQMSAIGNSHVASVMSSVKTIEPLEDPYGFLDDDALTFLKSKTNEYEMVSWDYYREINAYFFYDVLESDEVIVLWGRQMSMFFITPKTLAELKERQ